MNLKKTIVALTVAATLTTSIPLLSFAETPGSAVVDTTTVVTDVPTTTAPVMVTTTTAPKPPVVAPKPLTQAQIRYLSILHVNSLKYAHGNPKPAMEAFRIVASLRPKPWTTKQIKSWEIAIANIMMGESGFCPNTLRGATFRPDTCTLIKQGRYEDAGFGQLIGINYRYTRPGTGWLCAQEHLCSKWQIIASPYNSMTALVALIERSGTHPWCYNSWARRYHRIACQHPGLNVP